MANKSFGVYASDPSESSAEIKDQLLLEVGKTYIACILLKEKNKLIGGFEMFNFTENEAKDFSLLFSSIVKNSALLNKSYPKTQVFINNELSVLVPILKFSKEIAAPYLNVVFGEDYISEILFEHVPVESGIMNVFRINSNCYTELNAFLAKPAFRHTWSKVMKNLEVNSSNFTPEFISVLFYHGYLTAVVIKDEKVQLIQSFSYDTPEDVLYHLLNVTERFQMSNDVTLQISGMIDLDFKVYRELIKYFQNVSVQCVDNSRLALDLKGHPLHYFTPFFNLAI